MPVADLAHALEVAGRRREAAAGVLHRLDEHRGDGVRALDLDGELDLVGGPAAERLEVVAVLGCAVEVGVVRLVRAGHERLEPLLRVRYAGDRQRALRRAVIGDVAADHLGLHRLADELPVLLGELPRGLDGLAAAGGEEDLVQVAGSEVGQPVGQFDRLRVRVGPQREEGEFARLLERGLGEFTAAVPGLHDEQAGEPVQVALAVHVEDPRAVAAHDRRHGRVRVGRQLGEVHPQVFARRVGQPVASGRWRRGGHRCCSRFGVRASSRAPVVGLLDEFEIEERSRSA